MERPATAGQPLTSAKSSARSWHHDAACAQVGGDWWFPEPHSHIPSPVISICVACPARRSCLIFALTSDVLHGVWAALGPGEVWSLRQRLLAGEPVAAIIDEGLTLGDARERDSAAVYYRSAPSNPAAGEVARQTRAVTELIMGAGIDTDDEEPTAADLAEVEQLLTWPPAA